MDVRYKEHVALLGRNGCGKTTLLRMVLGEIPADEGSLNWEAADRRLSSQQVHFPKEDVSVLEAFRDRLKVIGEGKAREERDTCLPGEHYLRRWRIFPEEKSRLYLKTDADRVILRRMHRFFCRRKR